ncbi:hypothetical protein HanPSC8_Chr08g0335161 [Helianthus annuus]|nr:hypothetical protein HanPSC8_Chr08g0335161 [Helianthus annuus]
MRSSKISPNLLARSVKFRWFKSSPTCNQLPKIGTGIGPGGSLNFLPRSLEIIIAPIMAANKATRVFSMRRRSMVGCCGWLRWWCCDFWGMVGGFIGVTDGVRWSDGRRGVGQMGNG